MACALAALAACTDEVSKPVAGAPAVKQPEQPEPGFTGRLDAFVPPFFPAGSGEGRYLRHDSRGVAELTRDGMSLSLRGAERRIRWSLVGARAVEPRAEGPLEGRLNFFVGDPSRWRADVPTYSRLVYEGVYPGIDLVLESRPAGVEYSLVAAPGADLRPVRFRYRGASVTSRADGGGLEIRGAGVSLREEGLVCYQQEGARRRPVGARYARVRRTADGAEYGVQLDRFDAARAVVIDPVILWSSYAGGSDWDVGEDIAVDAARNVYLTGYTHSPDFPLASPVDGTLGGPRDAFVMKIHPLGSSLLWATYLGGSGSETGKGLAFDTNGNVYVAGITSSTDFPATGGFDTTLGGDQDAFLARLSPQGALQWSSYLGGSETEHNRGVVSDAAGAAYVVGMTSSPDFPASGGFDSTFGGATDAYVTKISQPGAVVWSSYLGGASRDDATSLAVDASGNVYVGGYTESTDFPTPGGYQPIHGGGFVDGFVTKVNAAGSSLAWSTYLGGAGFDYGTSGLAVDATGVYGTEATESADLPIVGGFDGTLGGLRDAYVFKIAAAGTALAWSTFLGGADVDSGEDVALEPGGGVLVTGTTSSADFPAPGGFDGTLGGNQDAFVARLSLDGASQTWGSYLGGSSVEFAVAMAVDVSGSAYVTGGTDSADFPAPGGFGTSPGGQTDGFVVKIALDDTAPVAGSVQDGPGADVDAQSSTITLSTNWSGFADAESGIVLYEWAIGTAAGGTEVQPFTGVDTATSATSTGLSLATGTLYYVTVRATNGAGLRTAAASDGVLVDGTPPVAGTVRDGAGADLTYQASTTTLSASWSGFSDAETGVMYDWAIGTSPGATDVQAFVPVGTASNASNGALALADGTTYFVTIRATNAAGLTVSAGSDGVTVDATPPSPGSVSDGASSDIDFQTSLTSIDASWTGFADAQSGVVRYEWAIGTTSGGTDVQAFTSAGTSTSATSSSLALSTGATYYVTVRAFSGAGLAVTASSDGVKVDATPPAAGVVNDGPDADVDSQVSLTAISANWTGFADAESGFLRYEWAIGTTAGGEDVQAFTSVDAAVSATSSALSLAVGTTYYVTVRAINAAGLAVTATSDGVAPAAPPQPTASPESIDFGSVTVGHGGGDAHQVTLRNDSVVTWTIASVTTDNPEFVLDTAGLPASLAPGETASLAVTFYPAGAGLRTGLLMVSFPGTATPTSVSLSGTGVEPPPPGCGCGSAGGGTSVVAALLGLVAAWRRRRGSGAR